MAKDHGSSVKDERFTRRYGATVRARAGLADRQCGANEGRRMSVRAGGRSEP